MPFNRFNHSILGEIRPRFTLKISCEPEVALTEVAKRLYHDKTVSGERVEHLIFLKTPSWKQHYWSPEMTVRIEVEEYCDYTSVHCLIGPRQTVWALFAFLYAAIILLSTFGGIFGLVHYLQTGSFTWLWVIPAGMLFTLSIFFTSKIGQNKGRDQMLHLVSFLYHSLDEFTTVERLDR